MTAPEKNLLALERHRELLGLLAEKGSARVTELAKRFGVTEETIRRDLDKLESHGKLARSHGGAVAVNAKELPQGQREVLNQKEKESIAAEACKLVKEDDILMMDASSTAWFMARQLPDIPLTIVTNSLPTAMALTGRRFFKIICAGGTLTESSMSFIGPDTQETLQRYHAQKLFMSCRGVDLQRGASDLSQEQARVRRTMIEVSDEHCLLADHTKLNARALSIIAPLSAFQRMITDDRADDALCEQIDRSGTRIIRARAG